jgi:hypothetical protein
MDDNSISRGFKRHLYLSTNLHKYDLNPCVLVLISYAGNISVTRDTALLFNYELQGKTYFTCTHLHIAYGMQIHSRLKTSLHLKRNVINTKPLQASGPKVEHRGTNQNLQYLYTLYTFRNVNPFKSPHQ